MTFQTLRYGRWRGAALGASALALLGGGYAVAQTQEGVQQRQATPGAVTDEARQALATDRGYADLVEAVMPAVVSVTVEGRSNNVAMRGPGPGGPEGAPNPFDDERMREFFERFFGQPMPEFDQGPRQRGEPRGRRTMGQGSGFVIDPEGFVVTNAHVVDGAETVTVVMNDESEHEAEVIGIDERTDLALLKVDAGQELPFVEFADSETVRVGERVVAVGNPFGLGGTVTAGIVSAKGREVGQGPYDDYLQIDAPINRGNSGGPTFNLDGKVVGVNTLIFSPSGGSVGIGFAIASNLVEEIVADLRDDGLVERGWLGVQIQEVDEDLALALGLEQEEGALVAQVLEDSPAEAAGVQRGDVILSFGGTEIERLRDLTAAVARTEPGSGEEVTVWRDGDRETLNVEIALMPGQEEQMAALTPDEPSGPRIGVQLAEISPEARERFDLGDIDGALVAGVEPGSPAEEKGLQEGDVIVEAGGEEVAHPDDVARAVRRAAEEEREAVLLSVEREGSQLFVAVPLAQDEDAS